MKSKAFTLVEILVAIVIVGILSGFVIVQMNGAINAANDAKKKANLSTIKKALIVYGVENGGSYPVETGCTIGSCTTLDSAMADILPSNTSGTYTYESDGSSFSLSSLLSSGYAYTYDSATNVFETAEPSSGTCGANNNANLSTAPTTNLCTTGTASAVSGSGPWSWTCAGVNGGSTASCATGGVPSSGSCGANNNANLSTAPTTNLCTTGTASAVSGSGPWTWTCAGTNSGSNDSCSANKIVNGSCGTANKTYLYTDTTYGSDTFCATGTVNPTAPTFPTLGSSTTWSCDGLNTGTNQSCTASRGGTPVAGSCGTKNGKYASTTPEGTAACATGTLSNMTGTYSWTCDGSNGGASSGTCATVAAAYTVVQFTTVGESYWTVPTNIDTVEYLVVGGGGGGSNYYYGGGGGSGALKTGNLSVSGSLRVVVGAGGVAASVGGSSTFSSITVPGGSPGISRGGSAGGSKATDTAGGGGGAGGEGGCSVYPAGAGGGGAGSAGFSTSVGCSNPAGNGGTGISSSITGSTLWYAAGGGGSNLNNTNTSGGKGGSGIGGNGADATLVIQATAGAVNTGSGGGGASYSNTTTGGAGGSGIVIVRYINNY